MDKVLEENLLRLGLIDQHGVTTVGMDIFSALAEKLPYRETNPQVTELLPQEVAVAVRLLSRAGTHRTGTDLFEAIWRVVPMALSEQVVVRKINDVWHALMWRRPKTDKNFPPFLHLPGGYPLVGEADTEWVARVLKKEAGLTLISHYFVRRINMRPSTGWVPNHQLANMFFCEVEGEPTNGVWVPLNAINKEDTLGHHVYYAQLVLAHLMRLETMRERGIKHDYLAFAPEHRFAVVYLIPWGDEWRADSADCVAYETLDEAIAIYNGPSPDARIVVDDQGYQIL